VARLQQGALEEAVRIFLGILERVDKSSLGIKHEAACHYNLGVAYQRKGEMSQAVREFKTVLEVWPVSEYARRASMALERQSQPEKHD